MQKLFHQLHRVVRRGDLQKQDPKDDNSLDIVDYDIVMSESKWRSLDALEVVSRQIEGSD